MKKLLAKGVLTWDGAERRSDRYGAIHLGSPVDSELVGQRVRLTAVVTATCKSGHIGDLTLQIFPSIPNLGEIVDLGVGTLRTAPCSWPDPNPVITLEPGDGRETFWFDPRKLYRLHEQTVEIFVEETSEEFSPVPIIEAGEESIVVVEKESNTNTIQVKGPQPTRVLPKIVPLGDGLFLLNRDYAVGERVQTDRSVFDDVDE